MSNFTDPPAAAKMSPESIGHSIEELTAILVKHHGIHEGLYELAFEVQFALGSMGPNPDSILPGIMFGFSKIGLRPAREPNRLTVDAAKVNPRPPHHPLRKRRQAR